jgi:hypothetical protein
MLALVQDRVLVTRYIRNLRGGSQPILVQASDGNLYVAKFANNPQGRNLPFNESIGNELYDACHLPVSAWKPLLVTDQFLDQNQGSWMQTPGGRHRPESGPCFGSLYLGGEDIRLYEVLPGSSFRRVRNLQDFWLAWMLDICAGHTDNRQAIFEQLCDGQMKAVFVDHGNMFCGPNGDQRPHFRASAYLDTRVYERVSVDFRTSLARIAFNLDVDRLWRTVETLPQDWQTASARRAFAMCLEMLADTQKVQGVLDTMAVFSRQADRSDNNDLLCERMPPASALQPGMQRARLRRIAVA